MNSEWVNETLSCSVSAKGPPRRFSNARIAFCFWEQVVKCSRHDTTVLFWLIHPTRPPMFQPNLGELPRTLDIYLYCTIHLDICLKVVQGYASAQTYPPETVKVSHELKFPSGTITDKTNCCHSLLSFNTPECFDPSCSHAVTPR